MEFFIRVFREWVSDYLEHILVIGCGCDFVFIFVSIAITGGYQAREPNAVILAGEILMGLFLILYGVLKLVKKDRGGSGK